MRVLTVILSYGSVRRVPVPDRGALLVHTHQSALEAYALKLCGNPSDARDVVQDTFERALRRIATLAPGSNERAWLFTILHNVFIDRCRRSRREAVVAAVDELELAARDPEPPPGWASLGLEDVRAALAQLDEEFRVIYQLHAIDGLSYDEISQRLGLPKNTVGTRLIRARRKLKVILERTAKGEAA
jgi:RNA polymerase sigma-70 factor (ECF subfamily)